MVLDWLGLHTFRDDHRAFLWHFRDIKFDLLPEPNPYHDHLRQQCYLENPSETTRYWKIKDSSFFRSFGWIVQTTHRKAQPAALGFLGVGQYRKYPKGREQWLNNKQTWRLFRLLLHKWNHRPSKGSHGQPQEHSQLQCSLPFSSRPKYKFWRSIPVLSASSAFDGKEFNDGHVLHWCLCCVTIRIYRISSGNILKLKEDCQIAQVTVFISVPRIFARIVESVKNKF